MGGCCEGRQEVRGEAASRSRSRIILASDRRLSISRLFAGHDASLHDGLLRDDNSWVQAVALRPRLDAAIDTFDVLDDWLGEAVDEVSLTLVYVQIFALTVWNFRNVDLVAPVGVSRHSWHFRNMDSVVGDYPRRQTAMARRKPTILGIFKRTEQLEEELLVVCALFVDAFIFYVVHILVVSHSGSDDVLTDKLILQLDHASESQEPLKVAV